MIKTSDFQNGDYLLVHKYLDGKTFTPLAWFIQFFTRCYYHHCAVYLDGYVFEAVDSGVTRTTEISAYVDGIGRTIEVALCRSKRILVGEITNNLGKKYDYVSLLFQLVQQLTTKWYGSKSCRKLNCSSYLALCLGYREPYRIDPQDLFRDASELSEVIRESRPKRREYVNNLLNFKAIKNE